MAGLELWIPITIAAAFFQNIRSSLQKYLKGRLSTTGVTLIRFVFALPFASLFVAIPHLWFSVPLSVLNQTFAFWIVVAALGQIVAQWCLIAAFAHHNFAVASAFSRTEPIHAALFGVILLAESLTSLDGLAIVIATVGVARISLGAGKATPKSFLRGLTGRGALLGLASGLTFGLAAVAYRAASTSLGGPNPFMQGAITLLVALCIQIFVLVSLMAWREPKELGDVFRAWRPGILVGLFGAVASFGWFTAMTMQSAALVKALAQIELLFTYLTGWLIFKEHLSFAEKIGCIAIIIAILILLLV